MARDTAHARQRTQPAHRRTGAKWPSTTHTQDSAPSGHTGEQEPSGPGHRPRRTAHRAGTLVNRSQVAQDTAHAKQRNERAHPCTGANWPTTPHTRQNTPSGHTNEQEPSGPGHRTCKATQRMGTQVNRREVAQDTAHTCVSRATEGGATTNHTPWVGRTGATQLTHRASSRGGTPRLLVQARPGCIAEHGKRHPAPWKQPVTGEPVHSPEGGRLPSSWSPHLEPQG